MATVVEELYGADPQIDLSFKPVDNPHPKVLTREQIHFYNENGYLRPFDIFTPIETERNRAYFDYILAEMRCFKDGRGAYAINCYQTQCRGIYKFATDPRIVDLVSDIVGPNVICWASHFFCKLPHDPKAVAWHQDASYWKLTPARTVTVWLAIDDVDEENSAMQWIPKTHNIGHVKWRKATTPAVLDQEIADPLQYGQPVYDCLKAGQVSLHADMIIHGSDPNRSSRRRCGLTLRYCPPEVKPLAAWGAGAILCKGQEPTGNWKLKPMPPGEDLEDPRVKSVGGN
jgi:hypothetical protein